MSPRLIQKVSNTRTAFLLRYQAIPGDREPREKIILDLNRPSKNIYGRVISHIQFNSINCFKRLYDKSNSDNTKEYDDIEEFLRYIKVLGQTSTILSIMFFFSRFERNGKII